MKGKSVTGLLMDNSTTSINSKNKSKQNESLMLKFCLNEVTQTLKTDDILYHGPTFHS